MAHHNSHSVVEVSAEHHLLTNQLTALIAPLDWALAADITCTLQGEGKLLSVSPHQEQQASVSCRLCGMWPLVTLQVARTVAPDIDLVCACKVAVAVECFICALDLLDDIEDGDRTPIVQQLGPARVLNVSTALLMLAQRAILSLSQENIPPARVLRLLQTLGDAALVATMGQQRDILAEQRDVQDMTQEECLDIVKQKAGSLMRLACRLGAMVAGADDKLCEQFSAMGELLGIAQQLDNDCHDLYAELSQARLVAEASLLEHKTDLARGKKTLPIALASALQKPVERTDREKENQIRAFHRGIAAAWAIRLLYAERVRAAAQEIEAQHCMTPLLRVLLNL